MVESAKNYLTETFPTLSHINVAQNRRRVDIGALNLSNVQSDGVAKPAVKLTGVTFFPEAIERLLFEAVTTLRVTAAVKSNRQVLDTSVTAMQLLQSGRRDERNPHTS